MSILPMYMTCKHCGKTYCFNPCAGQLGLFCPHCGLHQHMEPGLLGKLIRKKKSLL